MIATILDIAQAVAVSFLIAGMSVVFALCIVANILAEDPPDDMGNT